MVAVRVLFLFLINVNAIYGKSIVFYRRSMNTETSFSGDILVYPRTQRSSGKMQSSENVQGSEKHLESQIGYRKQMDMAARIISTNNFEKGKVLTTPLAERQLDSQPRQRQRRTRTTTEAPITTPYLDTEPVTKKKLWTTSLDPLRAMLAKQLPFFNPAPEQVGQLDKGIMYPVTQPLWIFEEYDDTSSISEVVRKEHQTCESQMLRCSRETDYNQPVCVVDLTMQESIPNIEFARNKGFHSLCEVDYRNCLKIYEKTGKYYADTYQEDYLEFLHYGWCDNCNMYNPDSKCDPDTPNKINTG